jgi:hypothetical protein
MKKYLQLVLVGILAVSLYACRDYLELSITDGDVRIVAELSQPSSRTEYAEDNGVVHVSWKMDDAIGIFTPTQKNLKYRAASNGASADLIAVDEKINVQDGDTIFAYYPYFEQATAEHWEYGLEDWELGKLDCSLYYQNPGTPISKLDYMYATGVVKDGKVDLQFQHMFAFLKVRLDPSEYGKSFDIKTTDVGIAPNFLSITGNKLVYKESQTYIFYRNERVTSDTTYSYVAIKPTVENINLRFMRDRRAKATFIKNTPKGGLKAGHIYNVSVDKEIEEYATVLDRQRKALMDLYNATDGDHWYNNANWGSDETYGKWAGIWMGDTIALKWNLRSNNLTGTLPESFSDLMSYDAIDITYNNLYGDLPKSVTSSEYWNRQWSYIIEGNNFNTTGVNAPTFSLTDINGNSITSDIYAENKLTLLFRWATAVSFSTDLALQLIPWYEKYHDKGFEIIAENHNYTIDTRDVVEKYIQDNNIKWRNIFEDKDGNSLNFSRDVPEAYVVDTNGDFVFTGDYRNVIEFIGRYFGEEPYISTDYSKDGEVFTIQKATVGKGIDLVFIGDGFVDKDMESGGKYEQQMREATEAFFSYEPYKSFRNRFNVYGVKAVSANSDWYASTIADHAVNENPDVALEYARKAVGDTNSPLRVGIIYNAEWSAGRSYTVMYTDGSYVGFIMEPLSSSADVLVHELAGHGFGLLLDEYVESGSETTSPTEETIEYLNEYYAYSGYGANVDWRNDLSTIRWSKFVNDNRYAGEGLGAYEGAATYGKGMYRPTENSMMRYNDSPFNAPSREQIYKNIMRYSEGDAWVYDYETFVAYDAINRTSTTARALKSVPGKTDRQNYATRHRKPELIKGSWRDYLKTHKTTSKKRRNDKH